MEVKLTDTEERRKRTPCYGLSWDPNNVTCAGGENPMVFNTRTGSYVSDPCRWQDDCKTIVQAGKTQIIPPGQLLRQPDKQVNPFAAPTTAPPAPPTVTAASTPAQTLESQLRSQMLSMQQAHQKELEIIKAQVSAAASAAHAASSPYQRPGVQPSYSQPVQGVPHFPADYRVPGFLTSPEPYEPNTFFRRLFTESVRAAFKGMFLSGAHFFDHNPFKS